jgi:hypothetical protein
MERLTQSFTATDAAGNEHRLHVYTEFLRSQELSGETFEHEGLKSIRTPSGGHVNRLSKGKYLCFKTQTELTSNDPAAP